MNLDVRMIQQIDIESNLRNKVRGVQRFSSCYPFIRKILQNWLSFVIFKKHHMMHCLAFGSHQSPFFGFLKLILQDLFSERVVEGDASDPHDPLGSKRGHSRSSGWFCKSTSSFSYIQNCWKEDILGFEILRNKGGPMNRHVPFLWNIAGNINTFPKKAIVLSLRS